MIGTNEATTPEGWEKIQDEFNATRELRSERPRQHRVKDEAAQPTNGAEPERRKRFSSVCPHCGNTITVKVSLHLEEIVKEDERSLETWKSGLQPDEIASVENAKASGLFDSYRVALEDSNHERPRFMERSFVNFFRLAKRRLIPQFVEDHFTKQFGNVPMEFWAASCAVAVVAGGKIRGFIPLSMAIGAPVSAIGGKKMRREAPDPWRLSEWTKTRMGYVPEGSNEYMESLRKRCIGDFSKPGM